MVPALFSVYIFQELIQCLKTIFLHSCKDNCGDIPGSSHTKKLFYKCIKYWTGCSVLQNNDCDMKMYLHEPWNAEKIQQLQRHYTLVWMFLVSWSCGIHMRVCCVKSEIFLTDLWRSVTGGWLDVVCVFSLHGHKVLRCGRGWIVVDKNKDNWQFNVKPATFKTKNKLILYV